MLAVLVTLLVLPALLMTLLAMLSSGGYAGRVPGGPDAMGLIVPFLASAGAGVLMVIAGWLCVAGGGFNWISDRPMVPAALVTAVTLGVGLAAMGVLIAWMERQLGAWIVPVGLVCGGLAPLATGLLLLTCAWRSPEALASSAGVLRTTGAGLAAVALVGYAMGAWGLIVYQKQQSDNARRAYDEHVAREAEWERKRNRTPIEAMREDYAEMSPTTPLWVFVAALPDTTDPEARAFTIERALQVPDFEADLKRTMLSTHPRYRHGCVELMRHVLQEHIKPEWAGILVEAIDLTAQQIAAQPGWMTPVYESNPHPAEHLAALADTARRLGDTPELRAALERLQAVAPIAAPSP
jgi:hypothetical protein